MDGATINWVVWVSVVEVPVIGFLIAAIFGLHRRISKTRDDFQKCANAIRAKAESEVDKVRDALHGFMLAVTEKYASVEHLKEVEARLLEQLRSIDKKLEQAIAEGRQRGARP